VTNNSGLTGFTFVADGSFTFEFADAAGNTGTTPAIVSRIDTTNPIATDVLYVPNNNTNQPVLVTLTINEPVLAIPGRTGTGTTWFKTYTANVNETVLFYDLVGNAGSTGIFIDRIDTSLLVGSISYNPTGPTSGDVVASISFNKT
jgi:pimeloyl-ACP methyl ester carboxylesterase